MVEATMLEETKSETLELPTPVTLEEILIDARKLSAYDKLMLVQMLVEELLREPLIVHSRPKMVVELYTPYEIEGDSDALIAQLNAAPPPMRTQHAS